MIELLDIVVGDDDGVVDDDAKGDDETGEGHLMQLDADRGQDGDGDRDGDRDRHRSDGGDAERQEEHRHQDHRRERDRELAREVHHAVLDGRRLVGDELDREVGRQRLLYCRDLFANLLAEGDDVVPLLHLH